MCPLYSDYERKSARNYTRRRELESVSSPFASIFSGIPVYEQDTHGYKDEEYVDRIADGLRTHGIDSVITEAQYADDSAIDASHMVILVAPEHVRRAKAILNA